MERIKRFKGLERIKRFKGLKRLKRFKGYAARYIEQFVSFVFKKAIRVQKKYG